MARTNFEKWLGQLPLLVRGRGAAHGCCPRLWLPMPRLNGVDALEVLNDRQELMRAIELR